MMDTLISPTMRAGFSLKAVNGFGSACPQMTVFLLVFFLISNQGWTFEHVETICPSSPQCKQYQGFGLFNRGCLGTSGLSFVLAFAFVVLAFLLGEFNGSNPARWLCNLGI